MFINQRDTRVMDSSLIMMTNREFERLGSYIMNQFGIKMPTCKRVFLQCRLQKRLKVLKLDSFAAYNEFLFSPEGLEVEMPHMIDAISTNTTDFFREARHFEFLYAQGLDDYFEKSAKSSISVWSAGCATGEEPYSIAITLKEYSYKRNIDFRILATDISESVLSHAAIGIYHQERINAIPDSYRRKYLLRGSGDYENKVRVNSDIREKISFMTFNLRGKDYRSLDKYDIIFCRNVLIYFERNIQQMVLQQLCNQLLPGGYLFLGHSESITGMDLPLIQLKPTVFQKVAYFK